MRKSDHVRPYPPEFLDERELAFWLSCSETTVRTYSRTGLLPKPVMIGNLVRWRWADVVEHIGRQNGEDLTGDVAGGEGDEYSAGITDIQAALGKKADDRAA